MPSTILRTLSLFVVFALATIGLRAQSGQDVTAAGRTYVIGFPDTTMNTYDARFKNNRFTDHAYIYIYSGSAGNTCNVKGNGYSRIGMPLKAAGFTVVDLMGPTQTAAAPIVTVQGQVVRNTFTVTAKQPVIIYCMLVTRFGAEAWTPVPVEYWDSTYYCAAIPAEVPQDVTPGGENTYQRKDKMGPSEILVTAAYDSTQLTIFPTCPLWLRPNITQVMLRAGEAYLVQSYVDTLTRDLGSPQPDLGGSRIVATKPIGVISGNTRVQVIDEQPGLAKNSFKNMLMESLIPASQYGKQFVYVPTQDALNITDTTTDPTSKRSAEFVRIYARDSGLTKVWYYQNGVKIDANPIRMGDTFPRFDEFRLKPTEACAFYTDKPAQAMMHSSAVVIFGGTTGSGNYIGANYNSWSTYMSTMVPRQQWVSSAPMYAPVLPAGMTHRINIITDTLHRHDIVTQKGDHIFCDHFIPGTDLCWGMAQVTPGVDYMITGQRGAKFTGTVYGEMMGNEQYRPGRAVKKNGGGSSLNGGGENSPDVLHPSEYEEYLAISYGYPLASQHLSEGVADGAYYDSRNYECSVFNYSITLADSSSPNFKSVTLDSGGVNATLVKVDPNPAGARSVAMVVKAVDSSKNAAATIVITDDSNHVRRVPYVYTVETITLSDSVLKFSPVKAGDTATKNLSFVLAQSGNNGSLFGLTVLPDSNGGGIFTAVSPALPVSVPAGNSIIIKVAATPTKYSTHYVDTLLVELDCRTYRVLLTLDTPAPPAGVESVGSPGYSLAAIVPNPVFASAIVHYTLARTGSTAIAVYNERGERMGELFHDTQGPGNHELQLNCAIYPSGTYFCRISSGDWSAMRVFVVAR